MNEFDEKYKVVICYKIYESFFETNDTEHLYWEDYPSLEEFKKDYPECEIVYAFNKSDNINI